MLNLVFFHVQDYFQIESTEDSGVCSDLFCDECDMSEFLPGYLLAETNGRLGTEDAGHETRSISNFSINFIHSEKQASCSKSDGVTAMPEHETIEDESAKTSCVNIEPEEFVKQDGNDAAQTPGNTNMGFNNQHESDEKVCVVEDENTNATKEGDSVFSYQNVHPEIIEDEIEVRYCESQVSQT